MVQGLIATTVIKSRARDHAFFLRTVIFAVDPTAADGLTLEIVDQADTTRSFSYSGAFATEYLDDGSLDEMANTDWQKYLSFAAALPVAA